MLNELDMYSIVTTNTQLAIRIVVIIEPSFYCSLVGA